MPWTCPSTPWSRRTQSTGDHDATPHCRLALKRRIVRALDAP
jgi:hypothetical protein